MPMPFKYAHVNFLLKEWRVTRMAGDHTEGLSSLNAYSQHDRCRWPGSNFSPALHQCHCLDYYGVTTDFCYISKISIKHKGCSIFWGIDLTHLLTGALDPLQCMEQLPPCLQKYLSALSLIGKMSG